MADNNLDFWSQRFTSPFPWEREDLSSAGGREFEKVVKKKSAELAAARVPKK